MSRQSLFEDAPSTINDLKLKSKLLPITYEDIVFNPLTQLSCQNCGFFGRTFRCPPFNSPYYKTRENLKQYNKFVLIISESERAEYDRRYNEMKTKFQLSEYRLQNLVGTQIQAMNLGQSTDDLKTVLRFVKARHEKYVGFGSAGCHKCKPCEKQNHKTCAHPYDSFSSPEGSGIDLYQTLRNKGIYVESPPIYKYLAVCMVTWKE